MKKIKLTKGKFAVVDEKDFVWLNQWRWCLGNGYAVRRDNKNKKTIYMHRIINKTIKGMETDHVNRNKLDNRRFNLRTVSMSKNKLNTGLWKHNTNGYKGVSKNKRDNNWTARIQINNKFIFLGNYKTPELAYTARLAYERGILG
jgi:hypothetical protein